MYVLELDNVIKEYGPVKALAGVTMRVESGQVYGFLGRNGAGKSTTLQVIMGITFCDAGNVRLFGQPVHGEDPALRRRVGFVAQEQHFYEWMTATRIGKFVSGFYPDWRPEEYLRLLKLLEIPLERKIMGYSGGMRAKLALCLALAHEPELLLLDEPTAGMDAVSRREFIDIIRDQAINSGRTTLFSSHHIDEVEQAATSIGIIDDGKMKYEGSLVELRHRTKRLFADDNQPLLPSDFKVLSDTLVGGRRSLLLFLPDREDAIADLTQIGPFEQSSLEDTFISMVSKRIDIS